MVTFISTEHSIYKSIMESNHHELDFDFMYIPVMNCYDSITDSIEDQLRADLGELK